MVFKTLQSIFGTSKNDNSKKNAKNRLQMVLVQDRSGLSSEEMEFFRKDIFDVVSRYFHVEKGNLGIEWQRSDSSTALIINTPVIGRPRRVEKGSVENTKLEKAVG